MNHELIQSSETFEDISGAGGKGSTGHSPVEVNDNLSSKQVMRLLFALGEGEIDSLTDVLINGTSYTAYQGITVVFRPGTLGQTVIPGFSDVESQLDGLYPLNLIMGHTTPTVATAVEYIGTLTGDVDACRITLMTDTLKLITADGDRLGYNVSADIYTKANAASGWVFYKTTTKVGKCSSPYAWDTRVQRPATTNPLTDTWSVRVVRTTTDDIVLGDKYFSKLYVTAVTKIFESKLTYPNTALVGVTILNAALFNGAAPEIRFLPKGLKLLLPSNYTVSTRAYNETVPWTGAFKTTAEYTDNLSWVIYYSLIHTRWGIPITSTDVDVGAFYLYAKHCDELVNNGAGGTEPRYRIDIQFIERSNTPTYLTYLLGLGNAQLAPNDFGQVSIFWDGAGQAVTKLETNATVLDGEFHYSSNDSENRINVSTATFSDRILHGDTNTAYAKDSSLITRYGVQPSDIMLVGCTRESQATRKCRWAIWTNSYDIDIITFKKFLGGMAYRKGELINIMDSENRDTTSHHAVIKGSVSATNTTITLDRTVTLTASAYTAQLILATGAIATYSITETNGNFSSVTIPGVVAVFLGTTLILSKTGFTPRTVKVLDIVKSDNEYEITCASHTEAKYSYIEGIGTLPVKDPSGTFVNFPKFSAPPITLPVVQEVFVSNGIISTSHLAVSWTWDDVAAGFKGVFAISYRRDKLTATTISGISVKNFDIPNPVPGVYDIFIWAINPFTGLPSTMVETIYNYRTASASSSLAAPTNFYVAGTTGGTFTSRDLTLVWDNPAVNYTVNDKLGMYVLEFRDYASPFTLRGSYLIRPDANKAGRATLSYFENANIFGTPTRQFRARIYCRDLIGDLSTGTELVCVNSVPAVQSFNIFSGVSATYIKVTTASPESDIKGYKVFRKTGSTFTASTDAGVSEVYDGPDTYITLSSDAQTYFYAIAAYDDFDKLNLTLSSSTSNTGLTISPPTWTISGLTLTIGTTNQLVWAGGSIYKDGALSGVIFSGNVTYTGLPIYLYYNPAVSTTLLQTTNNLGTAVAAGCLPLATYSGGDSTHIKGGTGEAFISGSQLIASSVGASALVAGSAVITGAAQIADAIIATAKIQDLAVTGAKIADLTIDFGKITDTLQSANWNLAAHTGWRLNKTGGLTTHDLTVYDSLGNVVLASGSQMDFANVAGVTRPDNNATVGANLLSSYNVAAATVIASADMTLTTLASAMTYTLATGTLTKTNTAVTVTSSNATTNVITTPTHSFYNGQRVIYTRVTGAADIPNLVSGTAYFISGVTATTFKLATTKALAIAVTPTTIAVGANVAGSTYSFISWDWDASGYVKNPVVSTITAIAANVFTSGTTAHNFKTGDQVVYSNVSSLLVTGLAKGTIYFVIAVTATTFKVASTLALANAGTAITIGAIAGVPVFTPYRTTGAKATFTAVDTTSVLMAGLCNDSAVNASYASIDFAIYLNAGTLSIHESGVNRGTFGTYLTGDTFAVVYNGGTLVSYYHNGINFHSSKIAKTTLPLVFDSSFYSSGASLTAIGFDVYTAPTLTTGPNLSGVYHPGNISTFIRDLAVDTLQIAGNAVIIPMSFNLSNTVSGVVPQGPTAVWVDLFNFTVDMTGSSSNGRVLLKTAYAVSTVLTAGYTQNPMETRIVDENGIVRLSAATEALDTLSGTRTYYVQQRFDTSFDGGGASRSLDYLTQGVRTQTAATISNLFSATITGYILVTGMKASV
jgi:predicted phage tail protein